MAKIYIVVLHQKMPTYQGDGSYENCEDVLKVFASLESATAYMIKCHENHIEAIKESGATLIKHGIDKIGAYIYWYNSKTLQCGITDFSILERELAE